MYGEPVSTVLDSPIIYVCEQLVSIVLRLPNISVYVEFVDIIFPTPKAVLNSELTVFPYPIAVVPLLFPSVFIPTENPSYVLPLLSNISIGLYSVGYINDLGSFFSVLFMRSTWIV